MPEDVVMFDRVKENQHVAVLTLNRPDAGNALNTPMLEAMSKSLDEVEKEKDVRVLIMRSSGANASFGADLNELVVKEGDGYTNMSKEDAKKHIDDGRIVAEKLFRLRVPTIGIVQGFCLGGGAELYTMCDVLYGASGGKEEGGLMYGLPEPTIGVMAGWMGPEALIKRVGVGYAKDLLLTGRMINGDEAFYIGLVQALLPKDELFGRAMKWAGMVTSNAPLAVESTRRTINRVLYPDFAEIVETTGQETVDNLMTADFIKGATKILKRSKEQPEYERR